jgi:Rrf2 family protein
VITKTSEIGLQSIIWLAARWEAKEQSDPVAPREIAAALGSSPTYTAKVLAILVRAGLLRSFRGAAGGVTLIRPPAQISLLEVVEACQGKMMADYCSDYKFVQRTCAWHQAMWEWHEATTSVLAKWSIGDLLCKSQPDKSLRGTVPCRLSFLHRKAGQ